MDVDRKKVRHIQIWIQPELNKTEKTSKLKRMLCVNALLCYLFEKWQHSMNENALYLKTAIPTNK